MAQEISKNTIEKLSWFLMQTYSMFHSDLIERAIFDDDVDEILFREGVASIDKAIEDDANGGPDSDEFTPEGWEEV